MQRLTKVVCVIASVCVLAVLGDWIVYQMYVVRPVMNETQKILAQADPEDRNPPPAVQRGVLADFHDSTGVANQVARELSLRLSSQHPGQQQHINRFFREILIAHVCRDLPVEQLVGLYATIAYNGIDRGMNSLSLRMFAKPLDQLSVDQAAIIEAFLAGPSYAIRHPDFLQNRRDRILARMKTLDMLSPRP